DHANLPEVERDEIAGDVQPKAEALGGGVLSVANLPESLEEQVLIFQRNSRPLIGDADFRATLGGAPSPEIDASAGRGEFDRVDREIDQDASGFFGVGINLGKIRIEILNHL